MVPLTVSQTVATLRDWHGRSSKVKVTAIFPQHGDWINPFLGELEIISDSGAVVIRAADHSFMLDFSEEGTVVLFGDSDSNEVPAPLTSAVDNKFEVLDFSLLQGDRCWLVETRQG